ncbi:MAG: protein kinase, partial [Blastocatellia bacterium]|nr:protein kinase [Blastocatellia bacterium]
MVDNLSKVIAGLRQAILPLFCLACLIFPSISFGQQLLELDDQKGRYPLGLYIDYLEDRKGELKIEELKSAEYADRFIHSREEKPNFGINPSVYWARFTLRNKTNYDQDWLLEVDFPLFGSVTLYTPQDGSYKVLQGGLFAPFNRREVAYRNDVYRLRMLSGEEKTFFLRVDNKGTKSLPLILWKPESFIETVSKEQLLMGLFYGIYIVMILYNLYLFAVLRDKNYLLYVCYVLVNGLFHFTYTGLSFQYLWPNSVILTSSMMFAFVGLSITFGSLFARGVLMLRSLVPTMDKAVLGVSFSGLLILLTGLLDNPVAPVITAVCGLVNPPIVIISSYTVLRKGYTPARFYLIAWLPVVVSLALTSFLNFGLIPINFITRYSLQISSTFTVILFSMALADRINVINRQRLEAEEEALRQQNLRNKELEMHNKELEQKVAERTNELVTSIKKLEIANQEAERKNVELIESHQRADRIFSALAEALPGTVLDGKYKLEDKIGGGGFGAVFRAKQLALGRTVAVKVFKPTPGNDSADAVERFKMEGVSASRLSHPNAVTVIDSAISQEGIAYLVMEYLSGRSLTQELRIEKKLSVKRAAEIIIPVCNALSEAHRL